MPTTQDPDTPEVDLTRFRVETYSNVLSGLWHDCAPTALVMFVTGRNLEEIRAAARAHVCDTQETP